MSKRAVRTLALLTFLLLASQAVHAGLRFRVELSEIANLTYQMDCAGGLVSCQSADYQAFWDQRFLKTPEDRKQLDDWVALRQKYSQEINFTSTQESPLTGRHGGIDQSVKLRIAGFQAVDLADYASRLDLLVEPTDRDRFLRPVQHFFPAFDTWWKSQALPKGTPFARSLESLLAAPAVASALARIDHFYAPELADGSVLRISLMARPALGETGSSGQQVEGTSVVEFLPDERPEDRIDVVIHELCHFLFDSSPDAAFAELQKRFLIRGQASAIAAYNLLNEALATALGNGMIGRAVMGPQRFAVWQSQEGSFYNNPNIDRAGKALLPLLDGWLAEDRTMFDSLFVDTYLQTLEKAFGPSLAAPQLLLSEMYLMSDARLGTGLRHNVRRTLHVASMYSEQAAWSEPGLLADYRKHPRLNALFLVHSENVKELATHGVLPAAETQAIATRVARDGQALYAFERSPGAYSFILVAKDAETVQKLLDELAAAKEVFKGFQSP